MMWILLILAALAVAVFVYLLCKASGDYDERCDLHELERQLKEKEEERSSWFE